MLSPDRLRTALDAAGIGHTTVRSLGHPDRWVTACTVSIEDFARVVEKLVREEQTNHKEVPHGTQA